MIHEIRFKTNFSIPERERKETKNLELNLSEINFLHQVLMHNYQVVDFTKNLIHIL